MPYCDRCYAKSDQIEHGGDVQPVQEKFGFGRTRTRWLPVKNWCRSCRGERQGHWRKADGFVDNPRPGRAKAVPDGDLFTPFEE